MNLFAALLVACGVTAFPIWGAHATTRNLNGPALILNGGGALEGPLATQWRWVHDTLFGARAGRAGNAVVLRASYGDIYGRPFYRAGNFASVQTILIPPCASRAAVDAVAPLVAKADVVYFAGGDQANYARWKGSALLRAIDRVYARGGAVGGGSAGLAIQGAIVFDSVAADARGNDVHTADAVKYPLEPRISFTTDYFAWPPLANTIADTHFSVRDRFGRSVVFLARIKSGKLLPAPTIYALGVDQASVVLVDRNGIATVRNGPAPGALGAYLIRATQTPHLTRGTPIRYTVEVSHIARDGERFDLLHKTANEPWHRVIVNGAKTPPYNRDPYHP